MKNNNISIIISAYKASEFIEECLDSIINQTYFLKNNIKYEILLGIDGCEETLNKVKKIKDKYEKMSIFYMIKNNGTYITTNTLLNYAKFDYILRFDSDDIMREEMILKLFNNINGYDAIRFKSKILNTNTVRFFEYGAVFFNKKIFDLFGGYESWICGADSELLRRIEKHVKIKYLDEVLFIKRIHDKALTQLYKHGGDIRKEKIKLINSKNYNKIIKIDRNIGEHIKI